ncbi:hypothetical protein E4K67_06985 [Desulfosporosinus fructosivorans]|uniref:Uncharacterized protein n=1 Tax=Desulfosporosinus fructosivorans TaxID=2018669 RepID=A0A4Z0RAL8_9FIRM|nr:hypothetical protein [Desulfosporosinus fructosivorans]TGE39197.1 hypothetical protein E4K67_06985 [Desulfosporosinus fructosivorans]
MRTIHIILSFASLLLVGSTLICGFWIHTSKNVTDMASSVNFHMMLATEYLCYNDFRSIPNAEGLLT